jgi:hypothetical protein
MAKAADLDVAWTPQRRTWEFSPALTQGQESLNQLAIRLRAGNAKWTAEQKKDLELLAGATNSLFLAFRQLLDMNAR